MSVDEIFSKILSHMDSGIAFHNEMAKAYGFLGLRGFSQCHIYHQIEETNGCINFLEYYISHYHRIIKIEEETHSIIPETWYKYATSAVDNATRRTAIKDLSEKWVEWEQKTKKLYQEMHKELEENGEIAAAIELEEYIEDVSEELAYAERKNIWLEAIGYDLIAIMKKQDRMYKKFKNRR